MVDKLQIAGVLAVVLFGTGFILLFVAIGGEEERKQANTASADSCVVMDCYILNSGIGHLSGTTTGWTVYLTKSEITQSITGDCPGSHAVNGSYPCYYCPDCYGSALARWDPIEPPESKTQKALWGLSGVFMGLPCLVAAVAAIILNTCARK